MPASLFHHIVVSGEIPAKWSISIPIPIWKGKVRQSKVLELPAHLPLLPMKVFERELDQRLREIASTTPNQCGFVKAIHATRLLLEKHREKNVPIPMSFLDLEKAFD